MQMSRRGIHPLLMGLDSPQHKSDQENTDRPQREEAQTSGLESAQRKRFLKSKSEEASQET